MSKDKLIEYIVNRDVEGMKKGMLNDLLVFGFKGYSKMSKEELERIVRSIKNEEVK